MTYGQFCALFLVGVRPQIRKFSRDTMRHRLALRRAFAREAPPMNADAGGREEMEFPGLVRSRADAYVPHAPNKECAVGGTIG